jgi:hypothetical protein
LSKGQRARSVGLCQAAATEKRPGNCADGALTVWLPMPSEEARFVVDFMG